MTTMKSFHVHLVSDSTGETLITVARACVAQFAGTTAIEHVWPMVRSQAQLARVSAGIAKDPGVVMFTLVDDGLRAALQDVCRQHDATWIPVLDPVLAALSNYLNARQLQQPGRQHLLDADYFGRIEAINFVMAHDDGQSAHDLENADVVLLGVSRTSKTPTCIYLGNRGIKAANVPIVPNCPLPPELDTLKKPLVVGLTNDPNALVDVRRNRLRMINQDRQTSYTDLEAVRAEVLDARKMFTRHGWPVLDTTRRSIEETAAAIIQMIAERNGNTTKTIR